MLDIDHTNEPDLLIFMAEKNYFAVIGFCTAQNAILNLYFLMHHGLLIKIQGLGRGRV